MEFKRDFISGVIEGFYGRPWLSSQRKELFLRLKQLGLNTYLYAPKDDLKHRQMWRELYSDEEASQLKDLIDSSKSQNVIFVYALSPGLDITFSSATDIYLLKEKLNQVLHLGCKAFALLFDDIVPSLNNTDKDLFHSFAYAQSTITNDIFHFLNEPSLFLFCPTEYCATRSVPDVISSEYLKTIGDTLLPQIDIMWTGPKIISKYITLESIFELTKAINRSPIIWDNIHANDYDQKRLFLGPYCGRSTALRPHIRGVLLNPNCEFEANFIAIHTLAQWGNFGGDPGELQEKYVPSEALELALIDWIKLIYRTESTGHVETLNNTMSHIISDALSAPNADLLSNTSISFTRQETTESKETNQHDTICDSSTEVIPKPELSTTISISPELTTVSNDKLSNLIDNMVNNNKVTSLPNPNEHHKFIQNDTYRFKSSYTSDSANDNNEALSSQMELTPKTEEITDLSENQNEMMLDNVGNLFTLTPMETEDNQADMDNLTDSMAMQVDSIYDNTCENMDIIDYMENNCNLDKRKESKDVCSIKDNKCEMECAVSNKSSDGSTSISGRESPKLTVADLHLLVNMFFLPYEHGPWAVKMLQLISWLRSHAFIINRENQQTSCKSSDSSEEQIKDNIDNSKDELKLYEWHRKAKEFIDEIVKVRNMIDRFTVIPNRSILYDLYPYLQDMRYVLTTLLNYVKWMGCEPGYNETFMNKDHEPWVFRGGLISEFQRMFPLEGSNDVYPNKTSFIENSTDCIFSSSDNESEIRCKAKNDITLHFNDIDNADLSPPFYMIQPFRSSNRNQLYKLCLDILYSELSRDNSIDKKELLLLKSERFRNLPGDRYLGMYLDFCPDSCLILEDSNDRIFGYAFGTDRVKDFMEFRSETYNPKMRHKYEGYLLNKESPTATSTGSSVLPLDIVLSNSSQKSVLEILIDGFNDNNWNKGSNIIYNSSSSSCSSSCHGIIHVDLLHDSRERKWHYMDSVGYKLIKSICAAMTHNVTQMEDPNYQPNADPYNRQCSSLYEPVDDDEINLCRSFKSSITTPDFCASNRPESTLVVFCEVDALNKHNEDFYKKYGFSTCSVHGNIAELSVMSRIFEK